MVAARVRFENYNNVQWFRKGDSPWSGNAWLLNRESLLLGEPAGFIDVGGLPFVFEYMFLHRATRLISRAFIASLVERSGLCDRFCCGWNSFIYSIMRCSISCDIRLGICPTEGAPIKRAAWLPPWVTRERGDNCCIPEDTGDRCSWGWLSMEGKNV